MVICHQKLLLPWLGGTVDWSMFLCNKTLWFLSPLGHIPRLWFDPLSGVFERQLICFTLTSMFLPSTPSSTPTKINKNLLGEDNFLKNYC